MPRPKRICPAGDVFHVLHREVAWLTRPRDIPQPQLWIEFHPDDPAGIEGIYKKVAPQFWQAVDAGRVPGLRASANK